MPIGNLKLLIYLRIKNLLNQLGLGKWVSDAEAAEISQELKQILLQI
jgi:hypothetical protein